MCPPEVDACLGEYVNLSVRQLFHIYQLCSHWTDLSVNEFEGHYKNLLSQLKIRSKSENFIGQFTCFLLSITERKNLQPYNNAKKPVVQFNDGTKLFYIVDCDEIIHREGIVVYKMLNVFLHMYCNNA